MHVLLKLKTLSNQKIKKNKKSKYVILSISWKNFASINFAQIGIIMISLVLHFTGLPKIGKIGKIYFPQKLMHLR